MCAVRDSAKCRYVDADKSGNDTPVTLYKDDGQSATAGTSLEKWIRPMQTLEQTIPTRAPIAPATLTTEQFPPLESVTRPTVDTAAAAYYLNRRPQTMRAWACLENGPLRPIRIHRRLAWSVAELRRVLRVPS